MSYSKDVVVDVRKLCKRYEIYNSPRDRLKQLILPKLFRIANRTPPQYFHEFCAFQDVSFQVRRGETFGIIGRNGSGKSTLLQILAGTLSQTRGQAHVSGRIAALLELGSGFNPEFTGHENVFLNGRILGLSQKEIEARYDRIIDFAEIGDFIHQPVKTYSSGMTVRLSFSVAVNINPEILIVDEALAVGDAAFQRKCIAYMENYSDKGGVLLFVSHSIDQVRRLCTKAIYLKTGGAVVGNAKDMCDLYEKDLFENQANGFQKFVLNTDPVQYSRERNLVEIENAMPFEFPECAIHYGNKDAKIYKCWTSDVHGNRKTTFDTGEEIFWRFQIIFTTDCKDLFYGLMVKTKEGINLFGTNTLEMGVPLTNFKAGDDVSIEFKIDSHLGPGEYFLNCSVAQGDTLDPNFVHRIVDAEVITIRENGNGSSGLIDMTISCNIDKRLKK